MELNTKTKAQAIAKLKEKQLLEFEKLIEDNKREFDNNLLIQESLILLHSERIEAMKKQHIKDEEALLFNDDTLRELDKISKRCDEIYTTLCDCENEANIFDNKVALKQNDDGSVDVSYDAYLEKINEVKKAYEEAKIEQLRRPLKKNERKEIDSTFKKRKEKFWKNLQQNSLITNENILIEFDTFDDKRSVLESVYELAKKIMIQIVQMHITELTNLSMIQRLERHHRYNPEYQLDEINSVTNRQTDDIKTVLSMFDKLEAKTIDYIKLKNNGFVKYPECIELQIEGAINAQKILAEEFKIEEELLSSKIGMVLKNNPCLINLQKQELNRFYKSHKCKFKALVKTLTDSLISVNQSSSISSIDNLKELVCCYYDDQVNACSSVQIHLIDSGEYKEYIQNN